MADGVEIDLYDDIEDEFSQDADFGGGGDLYDDVITASSSRSSTEITSPYIPDQKPNPMFGHVDLGFCAQPVDRSLGSGKVLSRSNSSSLSSPAALAAHSGKKHMLYIGNLTWWTTDQDLIDAMTSVGVLDLIDIKFYENRANGQSKGFALIIVGSEQSSRFIFDRLSRKELHGQIPQVNHFTKQALSQFEAQARKTGGGGGGQGDSSDRKDEKLPIGRDNLPNGNFINDKRGPPPPIASPLPQGFPPRLSGPPPLRSGAPPVTGPPPRSVAPMNFAQLVRACTDYLTTAPPGTLTQVVGPPPGMPPLPLRPGQVGNLGTPSHNEPPRLGPPPLHLRGPPPIDTRAPPPMRPEWEHPPTSGRPPMPGGPPVIKEFLRNPHQGPPASYAPGGPPPPQSVATSGLRPPLLTGQALPPPNLLPVVSAPTAGLVPPPGHLAYYVPPIVGPPPTTSHPPPDPYGRPPPSSYPEIPYSRPPERYEPLPPQVSDQEFEEIFQRNKTVSSSAINRAVQDASSGDFPSAIETLVTAISLIKQSKIASDDRCKILISSLQDTLHGIEEKSYGSRSSRRSRSRDRDRDRDRIEKRSRHRSRSRDRDLHDYRESSRDRDRERDRHYDDRRDRERERERSERSDRGDRDRERSERSDRGDRDRERERSERERSDRERAERERSDRERAERERSDRERSERERSERDRVERERSDRERAERERERSDRERSDRERDYSTSRRH